MSRGGVPALVATAVAALAVTGAPAVAAPAAPESPPVTATTRIASGPYLFGDPVRARLDVVVDPTRVDPGSVRVESSFDPYAPAGRPRRTRASADGTVRLAWDYTLECVWIECLGSQTHPRRIVPKASAVEYRTRRGKTGVLKVDWRPFRLVYRTFPLAQDAQSVSSNVVNAFASLRTDEVAPEPGTWASPTVLGALVLSAAFLVLLAAALVLRPVVAFVRERRAARDARPPLTPIEEAVAQVEAAASNGAGSPVHREALALLARELRRTGLAELVPSARRQAWSSAPPTEAESVELTRRVREAVGGA